MDKEYPRISFKNRIRKVKDEAKKIGQIIIESHRKSITLLNEYDEKVAEEVITESKEIDGLVFDLEKRCIKFIAIEQPIARDLMLVQSVIRINSHIKRISNLAANVADMSALIKDIQVPDRLMRDLEYMADYVQIMLSKSINAFHDQNLDISKELRKDDEKVDDLFDSILKQVTDVMFKDKENITQTINIIFIARFFERIADRTVDISSRTIFMMTFKKPNN